MNNLPSIHIQNPAHLVQLIQNLAMGSFEKKYGSQNLADVINAFGFISQDLNQEQLNTGINTMTQMGFCPDAVLFRRWCLGQKDFDNSDAIANSYIGKHGALSNILAWLDDPTHPISVAEKQAYDKTANLFGEIKYNAKMELTAHSAFKDHYEMIVRDLVANRTPCERYVAPIAIEQKQPQIIKTQPASVEFVDALLKKHGFRGLNKLNKMEGVV